MDNKKEKKIIWSSLLFTAIGGAEIACGIITMISSIRDFLDVTSTPKNFIVISENDK